MKKIYGGGNQTGISLFALFHSTMFSFYNKTSVARGGDAPYPLKFSSNSTHILLNLAHIWLNFA